MAVRVTIDLMVVAKEFMRGAVMVAGYWPRKVVTSMTMSYASYRTKFHDFRKTNLNFFIKFLSDYEDCECSS